MHIVPDHWIAISDKRPDNPGTVALNIVPLCHTKPGAPSGQSCCNNNKHNSDPVKWLTREFGVKKASELLHKIEAYFDYIKGLAS